MVSAELGYQSSNNKHHIKSHSMSNVYPRISNHLNNYEYQVITSVLKQYNDDHPLR